MAFVAISFVAANEASAQQRRFRPMVSPPMFYAEPVHVQSLHAPVQWQKKNEKIYIATTPNSELAIDVLTNINKLMPNSAKMTTKSSGGGTTYHISTNFPIMVKFVTEAKYVIAYQVENGDIKVQIFQFDPFVPELAPCPSISEIETF